MTAFSGQLRLSTPGHGEIVDLSAGVRSIVAQSGAELGIAVVFASGATVAVTTMEYEAGGVADLQATLE
ncbi:MAG TPA: YjbQ family protein, partial [Solirubrobacteraceae bacterium]|nr:YjbQ family protein [Solirubrobacteraceae bacterium]